MVIETKIEAVDPGGTIIVFTYGSIFGLIVSFILGKKIVPNSSIEDGYQSQILALIGTFLLWTFFPIFNFSLTAITYLERTLAIINTTLSMAGSTIAMTVMTAIYKESLSMLILHRAAILGGIVMGSSSFFVYHPAISLSFGVVGGICGFFCLRHLQGRF